MKNVEESKNNIKLLEEIEKLSKNINRFADDLLQLLKAKDSSVLDEVREYVGPRRNALKVLNFYEFYLDNSKKFSEANEKIENSKIDNTTATIKDLEKIQMLDLLKTQTTIINGFEEYSGIEIVDKLVIKQKKTLEKNLETVKCVVIESLRRLPKVVDKIDVYSRFLLANYDKKSYLKEYTDVFVSRMSFLAIKGNENAILQQTKSLTNTFNMLKELNKRILGRETSRVVNDGVIKILVLDLRNTLSQYLLEIDKEQSPSKIPFLIQLYTRLKHTDGSMVEEIEYLFKLKPEIMKIVFNCFIRFFGNLDLLEEPSKTLRAEEITETLAEILKQFSLNRFAKKEWVQTFGGSFGIHNVSEINQNFCDKCLHKITKISEQLDPKLRPIYIINNLNALQEYINEFSGMEIKQMIYKNCEIITGFLIVELESKTPTESYNYLLTELQKAKNLWLPEEERNHVSEKIKKIIEDGISKKTIVGNPHELIDAMEMAYKEGK